MQTKSKSDGWGRFEPAETAPLYRMIGSSFGEEKSGKSHFWMTAPEPIAWMLHDPNGLEGITSQDQFKDKDVRVINYHFDKHKYKTDGDIGKAASDMWAQFIEDYDIALKKARTVVWDKEGMVYELQRYANFGGASDRPSNYADLYIEYRHLIHKAYGAGVSLGLIQGLKNKWVSKVDSKSGAMKGHDTGERVRRGMGEIGELVQVNLRHWYDGGFHVQVENSRQNMALTGLEFDGLTFPELGTQLFGETTEEDWQ